jgi:hypothetical protein
MAIESRFRAYGDFRSVRYSRLYWLDIDVVLRSISYRRRIEPNNIVPHSPPLKLEYCVLEGLGAVANALTVGPKGIDFDRFMVSIAGQVEVEQSSFGLELRSSARMIWNDTDGRSPRLDIYIPSSLSRHLVELYVTKRINQIQLSIQIAVSGDDVDNLQGLPEGFPLLGEADHLYFRRSHCELLSVYTSLGKN